jgi:hypothetical protein
MTRHRAQNWGTVRSRLITFVYQETQVRINE